MMPGEVIVKTGDSGANMADYARERESFTWSEARRALEGLPGGGLNMAHEALVRHARGPRRDHVALRCLGRGDERTDVTFAELDRGSNRFANVLSALGVGPGERVFVLLPRDRELYEVALGTLKNRSVLCPLFAAFGPEPIRQRMEIGGASVLVTTATLYRHKVASLRDRLPALRHVLLAGEGTGDSAADTLDLAPLMEAAADEFLIGPTRPDDMALLHFTSGTTGTPKGAIHVHEAVVSHYVTGRLALDLHPEDVFWCTADPGWVTGTSYGIVSPLVHGVTTIVDEGDFDARRWYATLEHQRVSVWYTAPTALRMLMRAGAALAEEYDLSALRFIASVGEPLNPEVVLWGRDVLGRAIHDNWWQTETGGIMIANYPSMDIRPGSMGRPLPGIEAAVLRRGEGGHVLTGPDGDVQEVEPGQEGELALRPGWPSMFRGYLGNEERYRACFAGGWYLSGDLARRDEDGYFWFIGRGDDVIKSAGHLIGPFEVESALMEHEAVAEVGVIGVPDELLGEAVKAFVTLNAGVAPSEELRLDLLGFARRRLGAAVAPREILFTHDLPHTKSGKIMRRLLKARELGMPEGDTSTLEVPS
ncbi:MAG: acetate--CoA ligase [Acidobacteriota bacterium]|nr:acetate--CoA ligase [Acidobacteriota bacterium]MDE3138433.1 acetate--CoA ligase [Acidobacteriota bacterium]